MRTHTYEGFDVRSQAAGRSAARIEKQKRSKEKMERRRSFQRGGCVNDL